MTISCLQGAKTLVQISEEKLTHIQIQKILYLAQMLFIGENELKESLIRNNFLAWEYGPVAREVYGHLSKRFGSSTIPASAFDDIVDIMEGETKKAKEPEHEAHVEVLDRAYKKWGHLKPFDLVAITHWQKGAWRKTMDDKEIEIDNALIWEEFNARYKE